MSHLNHRLEGCGTHEKLKVRLLLGQISEEVTHTNDEVDEE